jgi:hypothetical protein
MTPNSTQKSKSRYTQGGDSFVIGTKRLTWWERRKIPHAPDDIDFEITPKYDRNPMLIAFDLYGSTELGWLIMSYNTVKDLEEDLVVGKIIKLPHRNRVIFELMNNTTGGSKDIKDK